MIEITGKYSSAKAFTGGLDEISREQIERLCDQPFTAGSVIRLMPDVHAGAGCTIGTTMTIKEKLVPNLVGVDIGCGMETLVINAESGYAKKFDPAALDSFINSEIPCGSEIRGSPHPYAEKTELDKIRCPEINAARAMKSIGTLGGGNHFIEADRDNENNLYFVIHSGSRHLGLEAAEYYQSEAWRRLNKNSKADIKGHIEFLKSQGREAEIEESVKRIREQTICETPEDLAYLSGGLFDDYINDMKIIQRFAALNRAAMLDIIIKGMGIPDGARLDQWTTVHNYIDTDAMILRKGAVSARKGERLLIPINMRDGSLVCEGLGNPDWNYSAPHGAGRVMSRNKAFANIKLEDYKKSMEGIYSSSVNKSTIDESPFAYKSAGEIIANIAPCARLLKIIKPVYNFKASEDSGEYWRDKKRGAHKERPVSLKIL